MPAEKINKTIENLCDYLDDLTKENTTDTPAKVAEVTTALAKLVEASHAGWM